MIDGLANFHFIRPLWLLLVPLAIGLWWIWQRQREPLRGWREQMNPDLLAALVAGDGGKQDRRFEGHRDVRGQAEVGLAADQEGVIDGVGPPLETDPAEAAGEAGGSAAPTPASRLSSTGADTRRRAPALRRPRRGPRAERARSGRQRRP